MIKFELEATIKTKSTNAQGETVLGCWVHRPGMPMACVASIDVVIPKGVEPTDETVATLAREGLERHCLYQVRMNAKACAEAGERHEKRLAEAYARGWCTPAVLRS